MFHVEHFSMAETDFMPINVSRGTSFLDSDAVLIYIANISDFDYYIYDKNHLFIKFVNTGDHSVQ